MSDSPQPVLALVTAPDLDTARRIAQAALQSKLAACVNLLPGVESHYWWQGKLDSSSEVLLILKTTDVLAPSLEKEVLRLHPYDTPEFVLLSPSTVNAKYLTWWFDSLSRPPQGPSVV